MKVEFVWFSAHDDRNKRRWGVFTLLKLYFFFSFVSLHGECCLCMVSVIFAWKGISLA